ncbi:MAG: NADH-quinone oxidoreductase subunit L [Spirosomataceae bacterium]
MLILLLAILFLPLLSFSFLFTLSKRANEWAGWVAVSATVVGLLFSVFLVKSTLTPVQTFSFEWIVLSHRSFEVSLQIDNLALLMLLLVHLIALLVQVFSMSYMRYDLAKARYFAFLELFIFSMLLIVLSGSLLLMYVGWELVGLSSYLLIGFWVEKPRAVWAAKKAFLLNRIGDIGFLAGILLLFGYVGTTDFTLLTDSTLGTPNSALKTLIGLLLFGGVVGKSAQFPLSAWLPDAMEGPTPVSALIHAATMVAAGIFLLARIHFLLTPDALLVITVIGTLTMTTGAYRAVFQDDIKKLLAFSTISQLGLMVVGMGVGAREAALFHLLTHAFFKAGLFLCAGAMIHAVHTQDMRQMGGLRTKMPFTFVAYTACGAALAGLPFFSGFLSKDALLVATWAWATAHGGWAYLLPVLCLLSAGLTAVYIARQWKLVFLERNRGIERTNLPIEDNYLKIPMLVLAILSVFVWFSWHPFEAAHGWFFRVFPTQQHPDLHLIVAISATLTSALGIFIGLKITVQESWLSVFLARIYDVYLTNFIQKLSRGLAYFDQYILDTTVNGLGYLTVIFAHIVGRFDKMVIDGAVNGAAWLAGFVGNRTRSLQNGQIQSYFIALFLGMLVLFFLILG